MARRATGMRTTPPKKGRRPGRPPAAAPKTAAKAAAGKEAVAAKRPSASAVGFTSKDGLRAQVEKLERANATLRAKTRESGRAAKLAADRIVELEEVVARLEKRVASQAAAAKRARKPARLPDSEPTSHDIDPGDAVPPGVAPEDAEPADREAEIGRENLEAHLRRE